MKMRGWSEFNRWDRADDMYLPRRGQGDTMATQIVTATTKLVYKWFNDGDVYDNTRYMDGWCNDLSPYANWLWTKLPWTRETLEQVYSCFNDEQYEDILAELAEIVFDDSVLELLDKRPADGSIYKQDGPFAFQESEPDDFW